MPFSWPACKDCGTRLTLSKIENDKWICKKCNVIFFSEDVLKEHEHLRFHQRSIHMDNS
jgi:ribosomal protein L37AE/L43A